MSFHPNKDLMAALAEMGISLAAAEKGLFYTGNTSVDAAASWVIDHTSDPDLNEPMQVGAEKPKTFMSGISDHSDQGMRVNMVFVVNDEAAMDRGKIAAQVAHAAIGLYQVLISNRDQNEKLIKEWEQFGCSKIVLRGSNSPHLMDIEEEARMNGIPKFLACDMGRTQVAAATVTALGLFGYGSSLRSLVGDLPLL